VFDFIRKPHLWALIDEGVLNELESRPDYELKSAQDAVVYGMLRGVTGLRIAEVGGGDSRILGRLAVSNECWNIDRFEGLGVGPTTVSDIPDVRVLDAYLGDFDPDVPSEFFDVVFSISVVEHVDTDRLDVFHHDLLRVLRPGGLFVHAIDMYVTDQSPPAVVDRFRRYRGWLSDYDGVDPVGPMLDAPLHFACDMATNPDNVLLRWGRLAPELRPVREIAQCVSLLVAGRRAASL
jgi:hypothetical protein